MTFQVIGDGTLPIKAWIAGVPVEEMAIAQIKRSASLPIVRGIAVMPDCHVGIGSTVGTVVATVKAVVPAMVGVDLGCGVCAVQTSLTANDLPDDLSRLRSAIEAVVPHGRTDNGGRNDKGAHQEIPQDVTDTWSDLNVRYREIIDKHPKVSHGRPLGQLGTLGGGNHFIEVCLDTENKVWVMLHSGSRGPGNSIGSYFINKAKEEMQRLDVHLPDKDLSYLSEGSTLFTDYLEAVQWAQDYALANRELMMEATLKAIRKTLKVKLHVLDYAVQCHHNYVSVETHFGEELYITRKGAVRADVGVMGIIPGSMAAQSFIVKGKGNPDSFCSCSHGAGRAMSRTQATKTFTLKDHKEATKGVECRKDKEVIDETPGAYKDIQAVMAAQSDLVEVVATLKQVLCVKG